MMKFKTIGLVLNDILDIIITHKVHCLEEQRQVKSNLHVIWHFLQLQSSSYHLGLDLLISSYHLGLDLLISSYHLGLDLLISSYHLGLDLLISSYHLGLDLLIFVLIICSKFAVKVCGQSLRSKFAV